MALILRALSEQFCHYRYPSLILSSFATFFFHQLGNYIVRTFFPRDPGASRGPSIERVFRLVVLVHGIIVTAHFIQFLTFLKLEVVCGKKLHHTCVRTWAWDCGEYHYVMAWLTLLSIV
ncbi:hypothetical protein V8E51_005227 [Hyaloscypha variabilis]